MSSQTPALSAPFVVSVTGHRDLVEIEALKVAFNKEIDKLQQNGTENCVLLSALATGADTLAANEALQRGWQVIAPLPLPIDEYKKDFVGDDLIEFERLLAQCPHFFVGYARECDADNTSDNGPFRDRQYAFVGEFLTRHCEVLIAFWDGKESCGFGGTGDVVKMQREGIPADILELRRAGTLLDAPEGGRVIVIPSKRIRHGGAELPNGQQHGKVDENRFKGAKTNGQTKKHIRTRREEWSEFLESAQKVASEGLPLDLAGTSPYLTQVRDAYLRADKLACQLQAQVNRRFQTILIAGTLFTVFISIAGAWSDSQYQGWNVAPLVVSWGFLFLAWALVQREKKSRASNRHQDYRALAEAWRIMFFWRAVGIDDPIDVCYLRSQRGELDWIRQALRVSDLKWRAKYPHPPTNRNPTCPKSIEAASTAFQQTFEQWICDQSSYFDRKFPKDRKYLTSLRNWSWALLIFGLCARAVDIAAQMRLGEAGSTIGAQLWQFAITYANADALTSPLVPAVLSLVHMNSWPIATEKNTDEQGGATLAETNKRRQLREWFVRQKAVWTFIAIAVALLMTCVFASFLVGYVPDTQRHPLLSVVATMAFFLPAIVFAYAEFKALPEHIRLYERMYRVFQQASKLLKDIKAGGNWNTLEAQQKARRIYRELGREALHENSEWLLIHRERPLDIEA